MLVLFNYIVKLFCFGKRFAFFPSFPQYRFKRNITCISYGQKIGSTLVIAVSSKDTVIKSFFNKYFFTNIQVTAYIRNTETA